MLTNGAKLGYKTTKDGSSYTNIVGINSVPDFKVEYEKVDTTVLSDKLKTYEYGVGDAGELTFSVNVSNTGDADLTQYQTLKAIGKDVVTYFKFELSEHYVVEFEAYMTVAGISGGGVNEVITYDIQLALASDLKETIS